MVVDIESWPQWTKSVTDVKRLDSGPLQVGSRARLKQPGLPQLTWELTELQQGTQFSWACRLPGVTATARHEIIASEASEAGSRLELTTTWTGPLAGLVAALNRTRTHRLLETEANGAKARSERALPAARSPGAREQRGATRQCSSCHAPAYRASSGTRTWASGLPQPVTGSQPGAAR
ncbi:MAG: SRPBCC family protein [Streptosporangiaceae bacterium]